MTSVGVIFMFKNSRCIKILVFSCVGADQSAKPTAPVGSANFLSTEAQSAQLTSLVDHSDSKSVKPTTLVGLANSPVANPANLPKKLLNWPNKISSDAGADLYDWRTPLLAYLRDPNAKVDKSVRRSAFKYVLHNDELYRRTAEDLLLKCLDSD
jgi:hypothetical protein